METVIRESHVKTAVKKVFKEVQNPGMLYFYMSVPGRYGTSTLDFLGVYKGVPFAIETKAPNKKLTGRQHKIKQELIASGTSVFVIDNVQCRSMELLRLFLQTIDIEKALIPEHKQDCFREKPAS